MTGIPLALLATLAAYGLAVALIARLEWWTR